MAMRSLIGKLRGSPAAEAVSRAFSQNKGSPAAEAVSRAFSQNKCEKCGKTSSRIASSLGQKNGAVKDPSEEALRRYRRKHYIIRSVTIVVGVAISWFTVSGTVAYLEDDENFP